MKRVSHAAQREYVIVYCTVRYSIMRKCYTRRLIMVFFFKLNEALPNASQCVGEDIQINLGLLIDPAKYLSAANHTLYDGERVHTILHRVAVITGR